MPGADSVMISAHVYASSSRRATDLRLSAAGLQRRWQTCSAPALGSLEGPAPEVCRRACPELAAGLPCATDLGRIGKTGPSWWWRRQSPGSGREIRQNVASGLSSIYAPSLQKGCDRVGHAPQAHVFESTAGEERPVQNPPVQNLPRSVIDLLPRVRPHLYSARQHMAAQTELKRGSAELMVLAALEERQRHGYEIAKLIDDRSNGVLRFHVASLYPMLYRMERRGWIDGEWVEKAGQRKRRYYRLTSARTHRPHVTTQELARAADGAASRCRARSLGVAEWISRSTFGRT